MALHVMKYSDIQNLENKGTLREICSTVIHGLRWNYWSWASTVRIWCSVAWIMVQHHSYKMLFKIWC